MRSAGGVALPYAGVILDSEAAAAAFDAILDARVADVEIARFLVDMADRGETVGEVVAAARALRARMLPVDAPPGAIDVCGTGGDARGSLNVSTAVAIVVAACGVPVAKHGSSAASSRSGAADVLGALGLDLDRPPAFIEACLAELGIAFLFAANHHPAMARVARVRRALERRTIFNLLGPLTNPAGVNRQLVGVFSAAWVRPMSDALAALGAERAMVVHSDDGMDELSVGGPSNLSTVGISPPLATRLDPSTLGIAHHSIDQLVGGAAAHNAAALVRLLDGECGAYRETVQLNTAAALIVANKADEWHAGLAMAAEAIDSGAARDLLARWIAFR